MATVLIDHFLHMTTLVTNNLREKLLHLLSLIQLYYLSLLHCCLQYNFLALRNLFRSAAPNEIGLQLCKQKFSLIIFLFQKSLLPDISDASFPFLVFPPSPSLPSATKIIISMTGTKVLLSASLSLQKHSQQHLVTVDQKYYNNSVQHSLHRHIHFSNSGISACYES